jgi:hypothetical protein
MPSRWFAYVVWLILHGCDPKELVGRCTGPSRHAERLLAFNEDCAIVLKKADLERWPVQRRAGDPARRRRCQ